MIIRHRFCKQSNVVKRICLLRKPIGLSLGCFVQSSEYRGLCFDQLTPRSRIELLQVSMDARDLLVKLDPVVPGVMLGQLILSSIQVE